MTTTSQLISRARKRLYTEVRDERDRLASSMDADDTAITVETGVSGIQRGATLSIDLEELYVWDVSGANVTVSRGEDDSTAATHADNATVYVNPKFSGFAILTAINEELDALSSDGLFKVTTAPLTYQAGTDGYDITSATDIIDILSVQYDTNDGTDRWATVPRDGWRLRRNLSASDFASGMALFVNDYVEPGQAMRVTYKTSYSSLSTMADNVETTSGLHAQAHDILPIGAAIRLTAGGEVARNFLDQWDTRRADEVPPQSRLGSMRALLNLRQQRIESEKARLLAKYPVIL